MTSRDFHENEAGFTFVELLVTTALALVVFLVTFGFLSLHVQLARTQPDVADVQQRGRVAADILSRAFADAGAWADWGGPGQGLACCVPVLQPRRLGSRLSDPPGAASDDVLTVIRLAPGATPGRLRASTATGVLALEEGEGCVPWRPVCGLHEDDAVIVVDTMGNHDFFLLGAPGADSAPIEPRQVGTPHSFGAGALAGAVETRTYYFDTTARQLRQYDGHLSDVAIVDDVVSVRFEYWGSAGVPERARAEAGTETCWFDDAGQPRFGRALSVPGGRNVSLALDAFRDGPWCGSGDNRFDADLLRVRQVRATVRVAAASEMARGASSDYLIAGRASSALRLVPDVEVTVDITPRMLSGDQ
jgi:hypothetical protein